MSAELEKTAGSHHVAPPPQYSALSTQHSVLGTHHSVLSAHHSVLSTQYSVLSTQYSSLITHHFPSTPSGKRPAAWCPIRRATEWPFRSLTAWILRLRDRPGCQTTSPGSGMTERRPERCLHPLSACSHRRLFLPPFGWAGCRRCISPSRLWTAPTPRDSGSFPAALAKPDRRN